MITQKRLKEVLYYNEYTGNFIWKRRNKVKVKIAGWEHIVRKYRYIQVEGKTYFAHRLAILYKTGKFPEQQTDHINRDKTDNRLCNLRCSTQTDNQRNRNLRKDNKTGYAGINKTKNGKWNAEIRINKKTKRLITSRNMKTAILARQIAELNYGFEPITCAMVGLGAVGVLMRRKR